jgi:hypothetical protein
MILFWAYSLPMVLSVLKETLGLEFLNTVVINLFCRPTYVNMVHLVFVFTSVCSYKLFDRVILFKILMSYLLLYNISFIVSFSFPFSVSFIRYVRKQLVRYLFAASLCCGEWRESLQIMRSVAVGYLYILSEILWSTLDIVMFRKLIKLSTCSFIVKCVVGVG